MLPPLIFGYRRPIWKKNSSLPWKQILSGHRESDGFSHLARLGKLDLSMEALAVKKQFTALFSDEEANNALMRLLEGGYKF